MLPLIFMPLQVLPTPTGGTPITTQLTQQWTGNFQVDLNRFIAAANAAGDKQLAIQFRQYALQMHAQHPELSVQQILSAFVASGLAGALSTGIGQTGTVLGQLPGAAAKGAANAIDTLGGFNLSSWFLRIGEILLGLVLVGVGVARITGVQNAVSKIVRTKLPI
jgi:hypothetical protein